MSKDAESKGLWGLARSVVEYFHPSPDRAERIIEEISHGSTPAPGYYALISAASLIASLGLVANSPAVVIGAMLVSPLMTPIFGTALGMIRGDGSLFGRAVRAEIGGVLLAIAFGALFGTLPLTTEVTPEMLARTSPTLLDLLVAVFAGLAGTLAVVDERISPALPGVAISTAIVPPLSTCGLCLAVGAFNGAYGAFLLFFANFMAILVVSALVFILGGLAAEEAVLSRKQLVRRLLAAGCGFTIVAVVLTNALINMIEDRRRYQAIRDVFAEHLRKEPTTSLTDLVYHDNRGRLEILATVRTPKVMLPDRVKLIEQQLNDQLDRPAELIVRCVLAKDISPTGTTSAAMTQTLDGTFVARDLDPDVARVQLAEQALREMFSSRPDLLLMDVDLLHIAGKPVILASVQSSRALLPYEVEQAQTSLRKRLNAPDTILLARCQVPQDITGKGRILLGRAHFGDPSEGDRKVEEAIRAAVDRLGGYFTTNVDAVWNGAHWSVTSEIVGERVITPKEVNRIEQLVAEEIGQAVKLNAWSRAELMVTDNRSMAIDDYTKGKLQARTGAIEPRTYSNE
ncbi:DUF389 domain-containing protein [Desulfoferrobacter suflitae]|uniref:DUF389 domain-containing protein n=1 Tax=Desulfoferrobacter suflitae TaxID=2865782 RepID=UPI002164D26B|nr:DUF389 domain-containing protein [Desulfoferrobacter suflitae]MCK8601672.1 DUF389 domain-containing protein [Desulfoferrobacter suflitae]